MIISKTNLINLSKKVKRLMPNTKDRYTILKLKFLNKKKKYQTMKNKTALFLKQMLKWITRFNFKHKKFREFNLKKLIQKFNLIKNLLTWRKTDKTGLIKQSIHGKIKNKLSLIILLEKSKIFMMNIFKK